MATRTTIELQTLEFESGTANTILLVSAPSQESPALPARASLDTSAANGTTTILFKNRAVIVITQLIGLQLFTSFCNGIVVVGY